MKQEILTAAQLRFHSYFVESEEIQKVMRKASDDLERLAVQKTVTVPVKKRKRPVKKAAPQENHSSWTTFLESLPTRPRNALLRRYGRKISSLEDWAKGVEMKTLLTITGMGESSAKKVMDELKTYRKMMSV